MNKVQRDTEKVEAQEARVPKDLHDARGHEVERHPIKQGVRYVLMGEA